MEPVFAFSNLTVFLVQLIILGFVIAALEMFFQRCMLPNNILYPYGVLLSTLAWQGEIWRHLARPLGRCRYCNSAWISFYVYAFLYGYSLPVLLLMGLTAFFVAILSELAMFKEIDPVDKIDGYYDREYGKDTPWQSMMWSYLILGGFYVTIYVVIPVIFF